MMGSLNFYPENDQHKPGPGSPVTHLNRVPTTAKLMRTKIRSEVETVLWEITGIANIQKQRLWNTPNATISVGSHKWRLSLDLSPNGNIVYIKPKLVSDIKDPFSYYIRPYIVNPQKFIIHSPQFGPDHPLLYHEGNKDLWEVMRFSDGILDMFSNYVFNDNLYILIELSVFTSESLSF